MKTIFVVFTSRYKENTGYIKRYCFNTESEVSVGDMLDAPLYNTNMQVVKILDKSYKYFNRQTGELSDEITTTNDYEIRTLQVNETLQDTVVATKVNGK